MDTAISGNTLNIISNKIPRKQVHSIQIKCVLIQMQQPVGLLLNNTICVPTNSTQQFDIYEIKTVLDIHTSYVFESRPFIRVQILSLQEFIYHSLGTSGDFQWALITWLLKPCQMTQHPIQMTQIPTTQLKIHLHRHHRQLSDRMK